MHKNSFRLPRAAAFGVALTLASTGLLVGSAAHAAPPAEDAPTTGEAYTAQAKDLLTNDAIQAVGKDKNGDLVVVALPAAKRDSSSRAAIAEISEYDNVTVTTVAGEFESLSSDDVVGGAGIYSSGGGVGSLCSIGFSAWSPIGDPALISAGHCTQDGSHDIVALTTPANDDAVTPGGSFNVYDVIGEFGFSQFGGAGNTAGAMDPNSVDVSVIDVQNTYLTLKPEVTDWTTGATGDLSASTIPITSVGKPQVGKPVSKSGRTTGYTTGSSVDIVDGWATLDGRLVYGFGSYDLASDHGDSGGAVIQGNTAVGILSGGTAATGGAPGLTWASDLTANLAQTGGYTLQLALDAPAVTSAADGANVERRTPISGTANPGTIVVVTPTIGAPVEVTTAADGTWTYNAPAILGAYGIKVQAKNGFNLSAEKLYSFTLVPQVLPVPTITSPAQGATITSELTEVTGTGVAGATITVAGAVTGSTEVAADGTWRLPAALALGADFEVTVTQDLDGDASSAATSTFSVVPESVVVTSPTPGQAFAAAATPTAVTGTGLVDAVVTASIDGVALNDTPTVSAATRATTGNWSVAIDLSLSAGEHTLSVVQVVDGKHTSVPTVVTFVLNADGTVAGGGGAGDAGAGSLAQTGSPVAPFGVAAALLLLVGAGLVAMRRRAGASNAGSELS